MDLDAEIDHVDRVRSSLAENPTLTASQENTLSTIIDLIKEDPVQRKKHSEATRSRRKSALALLSAISSHLGGVVLFLCSTALSITKLYRINQHDIQFMSKLEAWDKRVKFTDAVVSLAHKYFTPSLLSRLNSDEARTTHTNRRAHSASRVTKRPRTDPTSIEHVAVPSYHGVLDLAKHQPLSKTATDDYNDGGCRACSDNSDDTEGSEDSDESDSGKRPAAEVFVDNPHTTVDNDVQLYSNVYELQDMDVIRVVANQREDFVARLTVPHLPDATPFITINCPRTLAIEFLTRRKQVNW
ncbi:hypothetical protein FPOA_12040 [Fusarium poae]|uniref:Uncharacterized protein n=1 Tax=Fusarium poae TaxID=36050 RepID=A0A1B8A8K2_FUSPO|nr:hypothetical protein FPOA_12608 [Fusarium poae]OBS16810.1 hypothetical protein FPOA_12604 [Fusarium poae]OBS17501.1 hypothetical protein FPOA_12040 [Fusarium poae]